MAPTIDGTDVGEAWVAFQWASRLSARHDVTVLTYSKSDAPSASSQLPDAEVVEWSEPAGFHRLERFNSILKPGYPIFSVRARRWIKSALGEGRTFEVAHQVTPVAARYPSPLAGSGLPYAIGPLGGSLESPPGFVDEEGTQPWYTKLRQVDRWRLRHDPALRRSLSSAAVVLGIAPYVSELLEDVPLRRFCVMSETGLTEMPPPVDRSSRTGTMRLLYVGRLVRTKGARDAIRALDELRDLDVHLDVVGAGPDGEACVDTVRALGLSERVTFHGRQPRLAVNEFYAAADAFIFPSYREAGGNVQYEAMGWGLPLVVGNRGGTKAAVTRDCGFLVDVVDPSQYAHDLASAIRCLASEPSLRARMAQAARQHVQATGLWDSRIDAAEQLYEEMTRAGT